MATEARQLNEESLPFVTLYDINSLAKSRFRKRENELKYQIYELNANRIITRTLTRLRTQYFRGMKIQDEPEPTLTTETTQT